MAVTVYLCPLAAILQYFTDAGVVLSGGKVFTYLAGTSTPQATYTDSTGTVLNSNPIPLNSAGRLQNVNIWQPQGVSLKIVIQDSGGNPIGPTFDQIQGINDFSNSSSALANPASGSGADLVANAVRSYDIFSSVRSANAPTLASGQTLIIEVEGATSAGDGLGGQFYWNASSSASDDGATVIKPNSVSGNGRYLRLVLPSSSLPSSLTPSTGTFTGTFTGMSFATTGTVDYIIIGKMAVVTIRAVSNASNTTAFTMTGLPASLQPATRSPLIPIAYGASEDNSSTGFNSSASISAGSGTIVFAKNGSSNGWTSSGNKGFVNDVVMVYPLT